MHTLDQIVAEVQSKLKVYDQANLLDFINIKNWIKKGIKEFGGDIMEQHETFLTVVNGKVKLPDNFWSLKAAVKCNPHGYSKSTEDKISIQKVISRTTREEFSYLNNFTHELNYCPEDRYIVETVEFIGKEDPVDLIYEPEHLKLIPTVHRVRCEEGCPNLMQRQQKYHISIDRNHNILTTNFNEGKIFLWYRGLPSDEEGNLIVPSTKRDELKDYLIYMCIRRTLEDIYLADDDPNVANKIKYFMQMENDAFIRAQNEAAAQAMKGFKTKMVNSNRRAWMKIENIIGRL